MQVRQLLKSGATALAASGVEDSHLEVELLMQACLLVSRTQLFLLHDQDLPLEQEQRFQDLLARRCRREPLQYITGSCAFWSLDFRVTPAVLIPRPETEIMLEQVFSTLDQEDDTDNLHLLDLCTGSGIIAVVLAHELQKASVTAVDASFAALTVARQNARLHRVDKRIDFICADLLTSFAEAHPFDVIVTNPPYVKSGELMSLQPEVRDWEPELALSGGVGGMDVIDRICSDAVAYLQPGGWLFMEIGADIEEEVRAVFAADDGYEQVDIIADLAGRPRVVRARKKKKVLQETRAETRNTKRMKPVVPVTGKRRCSSSIDKEYG